MGKLSKFIKLNTLVIGGGLGMTAYQYPELRKDPLQFVNATVRMLRLAKTASLMGVDYTIALRNKKAGESVPTEVHQRASNRMYECFKTNGGPYIKLG